MAVIYPIILDTDGVFAEAPKAATLDIGGTVNQTFLVGGKSLMFADGTSTGSGNASVLSLQRIYDLTTPVAGGADIKLGLGKDLVVRDAISNSILFKIDSETGKVTITGDLEIMGGSAIIETAIQDSDHWTISPASGMTTALKIEPDFGVNPIGDIVSVRRVFGGQPVFRIGPSGDLILTTNIVVDGLVDGVDISNLNSSVLAHFDAGPNKHAASQITVTPIALLTATTVQMALEQLNTKLDNLTPTATAARGYEYTQLTPALTWVISHPLDSRRLSATIYDSNWEQIMPDSVKILDRHSILVTFNFAMAGKAMLFAF